MDDALTYARYPFVDGSGSITIATVRPATILADVAVAVHPDDPRYTDAIGKEVVVPVVGRHVPVIADERVEPEFGSGALKITPGHDPKDFDIGRDHGLETLTVIGPDGRMTAEGFEGLDQTEADERVVAWLKEHDQLEKRESLRHSVGTCERCHSRIEPLVSPQWWCRMDELAAPAIAALKAGRVRFHPESQHRFAIESLENAPDWCVSRQLWWGHQIPIWTCPDGHQTCAWPPPESCAECGSGELVRETDVLDTWFSSALWPFATLGWPEQTPELARYYPGNVNVTAREIIRLWENRMIFSGLFLLGDIPFTDVIINSTVLAVDGRRMSKSLGTGIDPLEAVDKHGADAVRYGLLKISSTQDVRFSLGRDRGGREAREQALERVAADPPERRGGRRRRCARGGRGALDPRPDRRHARRDRASSCPLFDFAHVADSLYHLTFDDFCDWYAEAIKPRLYDADEAAVATALAALERLLALLHPVLPHVTEEIWSQFHDSRLIVSPWPEAAEAGRRQGRARARAGGGGDLPPLRRRTLARGRREADLRRRRQAGAREGERRRLGRARAAAQGDRALARGCSRTRGSSGREARGGRGRAREARALPPRARRTRRVARQTLVTRAWHRTNGRSGGDLLPGGVFPSLVTVR